MVVKGYYPFSIVDDKKFKKLVELLNSGYRLPSRKSLSTTMLCQMYNKVSEVVRKELQDVTSVCIKTDSWTSLNAESFIAVTAHFINSRCELKRVLLDCYRYDLRHTAENLASELKRILAEWGIFEKVTAIVSDNAANVTAAVRLCGWRHLPCFAHSLNLVVQSGVQEMGAVHSKVKAIVQYFKRSPHAAAKLQGMQRQIGLPELKLKQDVPTRWNSTCDMFMRMLKIKDAVLATLPLVNCDTHAPTTNEWDAIQKVCDVLQPLIQVTEEVSSEKAVTVSKVPLLSRALQKHVKEFKGDRVNDIVNRVVDVLSEKMERRFIDV
ncbi:E3 SUMO-protein ligase ZBED1-like [Ornithodoros turicata]|uniref:E3 SUMO-protein ligase ZBED1-like n=1 Tax=Ornithodoros turicata TaxID=34597 RepID=UPI003139A182